jgi:iron complex outermembrane receptor protein
MKLKHQKLAPLYLAVLAGLSTLSHAEDTTATVSKKTIEIIQVTAQKRSQSINEVPMAITAIGENDLAEKGIADVSDLSFAVPGFVASDSSVGVPIYTLRGIGFNEESVQATSTVGIYIDEIAIPFPVMSSGLMLDIERVEVLKGPQGTLFGRNSTAGAINMLAAKPSDDTEISLKGGFSSYQTLDLEGSVSGALSDSVRARLAARTVKSNKGWQESITRDETLGEQDKLAARLTVEADLSSSTIASVIYDYWSDDSDTVSPQALVRSFSSLAANKQGLRDAMDAALPASVYQIGNNSTDSDWLAGTRPKKNQENQSVSLRIEHELNNGMSVKLLSNVSSFEDGSSYSRDGIQGVPSTPAIDAFVFYDTENANYYGNSRSDVKSEIKASSHELQLSGNTDITHWIIGLYYSETDVAVKDFQLLELSTNTNGPGAAFGAIINDTHQETTTKAIFANADWQVTDELVVTTGIRYSQNTADFDGCTRDPDGDLANFFTNGHNTGLAALRGEIPAAFSPFAKLLAPSEQGACITSVGYQDFNETGLPVVEDALAISGRVSNNLDESSTSWRLAANYQFDNDVLGYVSYSRGFKAGSFPTLAGSVASQYEPAIQEQLDAYEVGVKATLLDGTAQFNTAVFYYDYTDKQLKNKALVAPFGNLPFLDNANSSKVSGAEVDFTWLATNNITISGGVTYMTTEIDEFIGYTTMGVEADFSGSAFPYSPELSGNLTLAYETEVTDDFILQAGLDIAYQGERNADYEYSADDVLDTETNQALYSVRQQYDELFVLPSYTVLNARIGVESMEGDWRAYIWVRNLTDEFYANNVTNSVDYIVRYPGMPRTFGVNFEYTFD